MKHTVFIADLHLSTNTPNENACFHRLLEQKTIDRLYILGDFFALWIGSDIQDTVTHDVCQWLSSASQYMKIYLMPGNRDFLLDINFTRACNITLLPDPTVINLYGVPTLLTHGDLLCTADKTYQRWRRLVHHRGLQRLFLALPRRWRQTFADHTRQRSQQYAATLNTLQMDVTAEAVQTIMQHHQVSQMIHGHTHHPGIHYFQQQNNWRRRLVVGDWQWQMQGLIASPNLDLQVVTF